MSRPCQAYIDLNALRHNFFVAKSLAPQSKTAAVVKANAYGHGAIQCAKALEEPADALAVASINEAIELRNAGVKKAIILLEGIFEANELEYAAAHNFWLMVHAQWQLDCIINYAKGKSKRKLSIWLKVDSGMHRLGFDPKQAAAIHTQLKNMPVVNDGVVLCSHFACADTPESTANQLQLNQLDTIEQHLGCPTSIANSAALIALKNSRRDWNRPGIMLYGCSPFASGVIDSTSSNGSALSTLDLRPVMSLCSKVISLGAAKAGETVGYSERWIAARDSRIATIAIGYGDGYPLNAPSGTPVIVDGQLTTLAGRVSMDMITVDVTDLPSVNIGSTVELWGENLSVNTVAKHCNTIAYELLTRMPQRAQKIYLD